MARVGQVHEQDAPAAEVRRLRPVSNLGAEMMGDQPDGTEWPDGCAASENSTFSVWDKKCHRADCRYPLCWEIAASPEAFRAAQVGTHPKGGDSLEAPAPLSDVVGGNADAPNQPLEGPQP